MPCLSLLGFHRMPNYIKHLMFGFENAYSVLH